MNGKLVVSVDVEDWPQSTWDRKLEVTTRAESNTHRLLDLLAESGSKVTMFVLGKYAERFPESVRRIAEDGHEVASHGHGHLEIYTQSPADFRDDLTRSKSLLEDLIGQPVKGYRAPDFSITRESLWALETLAELGFQYDSSIFPKRMARYGIDHWPDDPVKVGLPSGASITELPIATIDIGRKRIPVGGGGYHRLYPWPLIRRAISMRLRHRSLCMAYCHPYEFDTTELAELDFRIPLKTRLHQGIGRRGFRAKFVRMLSSFPTVTASVAARSREWPFYSLERELMSIPAAA